MPRPAPEITLTISNTNDRSYPAILLRKFFAMVFIDPTGKKLNIFIATVFGGVADEEKMRDGFPLVNYGESNRSCFLNFKFQSENLAVDSCRADNVTDSFCQQTEEIKCVWCNKGESGITEHTSQKTVATKLKELYEELYPEGEASVSLDPISRPKVYEIQKGGLHTHHCMVIPGNYTEDKVGYSLEVPMTVDGLEAINWVKTELVLKESILDCRIQFAVELGAGHFYTPDFTWYFAPPVGSAVNEGTATLTLGHDGEKIRNNIQDVSDETTVLFKEWEKLDIEGRKKARVQPKLLDQWKDPYTALSEARRIAVSFEMLNPQKETNRQFMVGLVVAFLLAFCSDKTRINNYYDCLKIICQCPKPNKDEVCFCLTLCNWISILAPVLVLLTFCVYAYSPKRCFSARWKERHPVWWHLLLACQVISFATLSLLAVYIFGLWPGFTNSLSSIISCDVNKWIVIGLFIPNVIFSISHILIMRFRWKRSPKY